MTTVYKVVRRRADGTLASMATFVPDLAVTYCPHHCAFARNGMKLLAFKSIKEALAWSGPCEREVWEANATKVKAKKHLVSSWGGPSRKEAERFWAGNLDGFYRMRAPNSTVACDSITLIKRVDRGA